MPRDSTTGRARQQLLAELGFTGQSAFTDLVNDDPELLLASGASSAAIIDRYRVIEKKLREKEREVDNLRADNGHLRTELANTAGPPSRSSDNRALIKTQMGLLKREIVSQREAIAQMSWKEQWMQNCIQWYSAKSGLGLPKELVNMPAREAKPASTSFAEVDKDIAEIEAIYRQRKLDQTHGGQPAETLNRQEGRARSSVASSDARGDEPDEGSKVRKLTEKYKNLRRLYNKALEDLEQATRATPSQTVHGDHMNTMTFTRQARSDLQALKKVVTAELANTYAFLEKRCQKIETAADDRVTRLLAKLAEESKRRRELHNKVQELRGNIRVFVRVRPLLEREKDGSCTSCPDIDTVQIFNHDMGTAKKWEFDRVFNDKAGQADVFSEVKPLVVSAMDGYNVCIFAYGQTGSGKTHTMQGTPEQPGLYQRTIAELFEVVKSRRDAWTYRLSASVIEIYNEEIRDLLVESWEARAVGSTNMNEQSSRSHMIVSIRADIGTPGGEKLSSKINLVDLAGSERLRKSGATGQRQKEAVAINKSLSALGDVISARVTKTQHVPYRNSVLTSVLSESLGGDSKTVMLLQIDPSLNSFDESSNSLNFGSRVSAVEMKIVDPRKKLSS
ncbi:Kinesin member [Perkinsus chesapeaki]|uniref:Kinesin-like protein n=1 Tax=Perkinsus chesapeaki TaxID=330153 RepID=A0A7J6MJX2_PERCH|nr:Kinesin member [Perkinsus chesapeaki]